MTGAGRQGGPHGDTGGPRGGVWGPPWWRVEVDDVAHRRSMQRADAGGARVRVLHARRMTTLNGLWKEFALGWEFPDYFGHNPSALEDCLTDLAWAPAPAYLCVIDWAEVLLADEPPAALAMLVDLLARVGQFWGAPVAAAEPWDRSAVPFLTLLVASTPGQARALRERLDAAGCG